MKPSLIKTLVILNNFKRKGATGWNFPLASDWRKRISELRRMGYEIKDRYEDNLNGGRHKRYFLISEPS